MFPRETVVETREVRDFDQVLLRGDFCYADLTIEQGERESLTIEAEPHIIPRIETMVRDRKLVIRMGGTLLERLSYKLADSFREPQITLRLQLRELRVLDLACVLSVRAASIETDSLQLRQGGAGLIVIDMLNAESVQVQQSGAGQIEIAGQVRKQGVRTNGVGRYDAFRLKSQHAQVRVSGSSHARVYASGHLDARVTGIGCIEYAGNPRVQTAITGAGSVVRVS